MRSGDGSGAIWSNEAYQQPPKFVRLSEDTHLVSMWGRINTPYPGLPEDL